MPGAGCRITSIWPDCRPDLGAKYLTLNLDGTQRIQVKRAEMLAFLPDVIPAIQAATSVPVCFDNPAVDYHRVALKHYDRRLSGAPILNSIAASREHLDEMIELVAAYDTLVVIMASEHFVPGGTGQCLCAADSHAAARYFVELLVTRAGRRIDQILIDPGPRLRSAPTPTVSSISASMPCA